LGKEKTFLKIQNEELLRGLDLPSSKKRRQASDLKKDTLQNDAKRELLQLF
jgi:hypothetical protein